MTTGGDISVMHKKARSGRAEIDTHEMTWAKAIRLSLERLSARLLNLPLPVRALNQTRHPLAGLAATGPIVILLIGAVVLYQSTRLNSLIEQQLHRVSEVTSPSQAEICCLTGSDPVSQGWNAILDRISHQQVWTNLEERLSGAVRDLRQEWVARTFQQLPTPIAVTEDSFQIAFANQAFEALAQGLGTTQVVGHSLLQNLNVRVNRRLLWEKPKLQIIGF